MFQISQKSGNNYNISQIMNTWVLQMGYPVIDVTRSRDGTFNLTQTRFLSERKPNMSNEKFTSPYG